MLMEAQVQTISRNATQVSMATEAHLSVYEVTEFIQYMIVKNVHKPN
jgi:hypothetical protein